MPEGERLLTWDKNGKVTVRDLATGNEVFAFQEDASTLREVLVSADGDKIVTVRHRGATQVAVRDGRTGAIIREFQHHAFGQQIALCPKASRLAVATGLPNSKTRDFEVAIIDTATGEQVAGAHGANGGHMGIL
jgi:hypothetical protein